MNTIIWLIISALFKFACIFWCYHDMRKAEAKKKWATAFLMILSMTYFALSLLGGYVELRQTIDIYLATHQ